MPIRQVSQRSPDQLRALIGLGAVADDVAEAPDLLEGVLAIVDRLEDRLEGGKVRVDVADHRGAHGSAAGLAGGIQDPARPADRARGPSIVEMSGRAYPPEPPAGSSGGRGGAGRRRGGGDRRLADRSPRGRDRPGSRTGHGLLQRRAARPRGRLQRPAAPDRPRGAARPADGAGAPGPLAAPGLAERPRHRGPSSPDRRSRGRRGDLAGARDRRPAPRAPSGTNAPAISASPPRASGHGSPIRRARRRSPRASPRSAGSRRSS